MKKTPFLTEKQWGDTAGDYTYDAAGNIVAYFKPITKEQIFEIPTGVCIRTTKKGTG